MPRGRKCAALPNLVPACASDHKVFRKIFPPLHRAIRRASSTALCARAWRHARTMWLRTRTGSKPMTIASCTNSITSTRRWPRSMRAIADCGLPIRNVI